MIRGQKTGEVGEISNTKARLYIETNYSQRSLERGITFPHLLKGANECERGSRELGGEEGGGGWGAEG